MNECTGLADIGPFFAGLVALAIAGWSAARERIRRPQLSLAFDPDDPFDYVPGIGTTAQTQSHWVRVRVENAAGKRSADDVELLVVEVRHGDPAQARLGGLPLVWSNLRANDQFVTRLTLPPGVPRHVDLLALVEPDSDEVNIPKPIEGETEALFQLQVWPPPADRRHEFGAGTYEIVLVVSGRDTDPAFYELTIEHDGKWWSAEHVKDHLRVGSLRRIRSAAA